MTTCTGCRHERHESTCPECDCGVCSVAPDCIGCATVVELRAHVYELRALLLAQATDLRRVEARCTLLETAPKGSA